MISLFQFSLNVNVSKDAENSFCAALTHKQQLHPSPLELDCRQEQHDGLDTHDCVRHLLEMVNVFPMVLPQASAAALNPQLSARHLNSV